MKRRLSAATLLFPLVIACATTGTQPPPVVKPYDILFASVTLYDVGMTLHFSGSTTESPQVYAAVELTRLNGPVVWRASFAHSQQAKELTAEEVASLQSYSDSVFAKYAKPAPPPGSVSKKA